MSDPFKDALRKNSQKLNCCCDTGLVCPTHRVMGKTSDTPETDAEEFALIGTDYAAVKSDFARRLERQRNEARELLASEKSTRNAIIAKGIETERQLAEARQAFAIATDQLVQVQSELRQAREENARLREALLTIATPTDDNNFARAIALDAFEMSIIAKKALTP